jgi:RNA polymerase sigma-70 factor (ECF subfamily)
LEQSQDQICSEMALTETQFRLLKSRAKARFGELGKKKLTHRPLHAVMVRTSASLSH